MNPIFFPSSLPFLHSTTSHPIHLISRRSPSSSHPIPFPFLPPIHLSTQNQMLSSSPTLLPTSLSSSSASSSSSSPSPSTEPPPQIDYQQRSFLWIDRQECHSNHQTDQLLLARRSRRYARIPAQALLLPSLPPSPSNTPLQEHDLLLPSINPPLDHHHLDSPTLSNLKINHHSLSNHSSSTPSNLPISTSDLDSNSKSSHPFTSSPPPPPPPRTSLALSSSSSSLSPASVFDSHRIPPASRRQTEAWRTRSMTNFDHYPSLSSSSSPPQDRHPFSIISSAFQLQSDQDQDAFSIHPSSSHPLLLSSASDSRIDDPRSSWPTRSLPTPELISSSSDLNPLDLSAQASRRSTHRPVSTAYTTSSSASPREIDQDQLLKRKRQRARVITELIETEAAFARDMAIARDIYLAKAHDQPSLVFSSPPHLSPQEDSMPSSRATTTTLAAVLSFNSKRRVGSKRRPSASRELLTPSSSIKPSTLSHHSPLSDPPAGPALSSSDRKAIFANLEEVASLADGFARLLSEAAGHEPAKDSSSGQESDELDPRNDRLGTCFLEMV